MKDAGVHMLDGSSVEIDGVGFVGVASTGSSAAFVRRRVGL